MWFFFLFGWSFSFAFGREIVNEVLDLLRSLFWAVLGKNKEITGFYLSYLRKLYEVT